MNLDALISDALSHFGAGVVFSLVDYGTHMAKNPTQTRIRYKQETLASIERVLAVAKAQIPEQTAQQQGVEVAVETATEPAEPTPARVAMVVTQPINEAELARHVEGVKDYLRVNGYVKLDAPLYKRAKEFFSSLLRDEVVNNLSTRNKFIFAAVIEILGDSIFGQAYYQFVARKSPLAAFASNIYQIPAFFSGLVVGNGAKKVINWIAVPRDEKLLDATIRQLISETPVVEFVLHYTPPAEVAQRLQLEGVQVYGAQLTNAGKSLYAKVVGYQRAREERDARASAEIRSRFDRATKGH